MARKKPTKSEDIDKTIQANNRLNGIGETCLNLARGSDARPQERVKKQLDAMLNKELTQADTGGPALRDAVEYFWKAAD